MTKKEFIDKNGNSWEWEETAETIKALEELHKGNKKTETKFAGNYPGPLYAPHPYLSK